jgi:hypothetical protein
LSYSYVNENRGQVRRMPFHVPPSIRLWINLPATDADIATFENQLSGGCAPGAQWVISTGAPGSVVLGVFWPGSPLWQDGSISELALGAFQFCPGAYIRRSKNTIPARPVFLRFGICSGHKSGQFVT